MQTIIQAAQVSRGKELRRWEQPAQRTKQKTIHLTTTQQKRQGPDREQNTQVAINTQGR